MRQIQTTLSEITGLEPNEALAITNFLLLVFMIGLFFTLKINGLL